MNGKYQVGSGRVVTFTHDMPFIEDNSTASSGKSQSVFGLMQMSVYRLPTVRQAENKLRQVARKAGYNSPAVYHGTNNYGFTVFGANQLNDFDKYYGKKNKVYKPFYFSASKEYAEAYTNKTKYGNKGVYKAFLKAENPIEVGRVDAFSGYVFTDRSGETFTPQMKSILDKLGIDDADTFKEMCGIEDGENPNIFTVVNSDTFTSLATEAGYDSIHGTEDGSDMYAVFKPEQIKSADTVTYDDEGHIIPLSERFNSENDDIRYSYRGNGYDGYSMSNNARAAYRNGEMPLSKWTKTEILDAIRDINPDIDCSALNLNTLKDRFLVKSSWHHTSLYYNKTDFYSLSENIKDITQDDVDSMAKAQNHTSKTKRDTSVDDKVDEAYQKAKIIVEAGLLKTESGALAKLINNKGFNELYEKAKTIILKQDEAKIQQWRKLPKDHWRQEFVREFDKGSDSYLQWRMSKTDKLSRNSNVFKTLSDYFKELETKKATSEGGVKFHERLRYKQDIENWDKKGRPNSYKFLLGSTSATIQGLGAMENDILIDGDKINTIFTDHPEMRIDDIKALPSILENPYLILNSLNADNVPMNSRIVVFGSRKASNSKPVLVVMDLAPEQNKIDITDYQKVNSAYTKTSSPVDFVANSEVLYVTPDIKKATSLLHAIGFQMPILWNDSGYMGTITHTRKTVNIQGKKFSDVIQNNGTFYSDRNPDATDSRTLLSNALMETVQNDAEREFLSRYQSKIDSINADQTELAEVRKKIHDISFTKGTDRSQLPKLQNKANILANRIARNDKVLLKLESTKALKDVLEREKANVKKKIKAQDKEVLEKFSDVIQNSA